MYCWMLNIQANDYNYNKNEYSRFQGLLQGYCGYCGYYSFLLLLLGLLCVLMHKSWKKARNVFEKFEQI
jgi:hypothetical protein